MYYLHVKVPAFIAQNIHAVTVLTVQVDFTSTIFNGFCKEGLCDGSTAHDSASGGASNGAVGTQSQEKNDSENETEVTDMVTEEEVLQLLNSDTENEVSIVLMTI